MERYAEVANIAHQHNVNVIFCSSPAKRELEMVKKNYRTFVIFNQLMLQENQFKTLAALIHQAICDFA